jgi:hypothetical protein
MQDLFRHLRTHTKMKKNFKEQLKTLGRGEKIPVKTYTDLAHIHQFEKDNEVKFTYYWDYEGDIEVSYR